MIGSPHPLISSYKKLDHQLSNWYDKSNFISAYNDLKSKDIAYFPINEILHNYKENEIYEENFFYLKPKTKVKVLLPKFKKMFFFNFFLFNSFSIEGIELSLFKFF